MVLLSDIFGVISIKFGWIDPWVALLKIKIYLSGHNLFSILLETNFSFLDMFILLSANLARVISKIQVSNPGPSWPSCCYVASPFDLYQFYYDAPGVKTGSNQRVSSWNNWNKESRIHFVGKMIQVSDPGPS